MRDLGFAWHPIEGAHARISPGVLVIGATVEDAVRRGIRNLDFLRGQEPYKYWWGARDRTTWRRRLRQPLKP